MAFSTSQLQYIESIVLSASVDYPDGHYIAFNNVGASSDEADLTIIISPGDIYVNDKLLDSFFYDNEYAFYITQAGIRYDIKSGNPSSYNGNYSSRISVSTVDVGQIVVPAYNTVATNSDWNTVYGLPFAGDVLVDSTYSILSDQDSMQFSADSIMFFVVFLAVFIFSIFRYRHSELS